MRAFKQWTSNFPGAARQDFLEKGMFKLRPEEKVGIGRRGSWRGQNM